MSILLGLGISGVLISIAGINYYRTINTINNFRNKMDDDMKKLELTMKGYSKY